jgi:hypothetical protein
VRGKSPKANSARRQELLAERRALEQQIQAHARSTRDQLRQMFGQLNGLDDQIRELRHFGGNMSKL